MLPARYPNLLVNGSTGISAGYATEIPTHNLAEVIDGTIYLIDHPQASLEKLMDYIPGPDFPTGESCKEKQKSKKLMKLDVEKSFYDQRLKLKRLKGTSSKS